MIVDLLYDGKILNWNGVIFKSTSGMTGYQSSKMQCLPDKGPVPEGLYKIFISDLGTAKDDGSGTCQLKPAWGVQKIPRGKEAGNCEPYWANWGRNRVRLEPADIPTKVACTPTRGGFYIHDSTKGYSHGCIEVEPSFFTILKSHSFARPRATLILKVKYKYENTYGGTRK